MSTPHPPPPPLDALGADAIALDHNGAPPAAAPERQLADHSAAAMIQRNYRGHRDRRQLNGSGLDSTTRWIEAVKEAQYRNIMTPTSRQQRATTGHERNVSDTAKQNWKRIATVAARAEGDDTSDTDGHPGMTSEQLEEYRRKKYEAKKERDKYAKMMDLAYFLEMVDTKHRYGSNLRAYHAEWKKADTNENFFYWLDHGQGRAVEVTNVSRRKLEAYRVRYLSREERRSYLAKIDSEGRLCWAHDGTRISTNSEFRDSINGIVPRGDDTPAWNHGHVIDTHDENSEGIDSSSMTAGFAARGARHYNNGDSKVARGLQRLKNVSGAAILNHLLQKSVKPGTWIFVADTSFRLYVGIKQSGTFQHSSFLNGARLLCAGLIKIKDGQLRRLSPLSGHYRPSTRNFRIFVHMLKEASVDMSRVSISRSYAVLLVLEGYVEAQKRIQDGEQRAKQRAEWIFHPEQARRKEDEKKDESKSAQREREVLAQQMMGDGARGRAKREVFKNRLKSTMLRLGARDRLKSNEGGGEGQVGIDASKARW